MAAIGPPDLVERVEGDKIHVIAEPAATLGPQLLEQLRDRHDRRPEIEAIARLGDRRAAPADPVETVDDGNLVAFGPKAHGRGKPAKPRADDNGRV